jgi:ribosomal protein L34E
MLTCGMIDNTRSNKVKIVKTPGGKLVYQHVPKTPSRVKCGGCELHLPGVCEFQIFLLYHYAICELEITSILCGNYMADRIL